MEKLLFFLIRVYQIIFSPAIRIFNYLGFGCAFYPPCSEYSCQAVKKYGAFKGALFALHRIARCHPFQKARYDPLP